MKEKTNWEESNEYFGTRMLGHTEVPEYVMNFLKEEDDSNKIPFQTQLAGHIKKEYGFKNVPSEVSTWITSQSLNFSKMNDIVIAKSKHNTELSEVVLDKLWINYQKKHEFNPFHKHTGFLSFIIFVKIPYDLKEELKVFPEMNKQGDFNVNSTSKLCFLNTDLLGEPMFDSIPVDKSFEGKMLMFSASQYHAVYPFYTSDEERITVSGNLKFKTSLD
jgi:hypothetical protein